MYSNTFAYVCNENKSTDEPTRRKLEIILSAEGAFLNSEPTSETFRNKNLSPISSSSRHDCNNSNNNHN